MPSTETYDEMVAMVENYGLSNVIASIMFYQKKLAERFKDPKTEEEQYKSKVHQDLYKYFRGVCDHISKTCEHRILNRKALIPIQELKVGLKVHKQHPFDGTRKGGTILPEIYEIEEIKDHKPIDGPRYTRGIAKLSDGSTPFVWNIVKALWTRLGLMFTTTPKLVEVQVWESDTASAVYRGEL